MLIHTNEGGTVEATRIGTNGDWDVHVRNASGESIATVTMDYDNVNTLIAELEGW